MADFRGRRGEIRVGTIPVCTFSKGQFYSIPLTPNLHRLATAMRSRTWSVPYARRLLKAVGSPRVSIDRRSWLHDCAGSTTGCICRCLRPQALKNHSTLALKRISALPVCWPAVDGVLLFAPRRRVPVRIWLHSRWQVYWWWEPPREVLDIIRHFDIAKQVPMLLLWLCQRMVRYPYWGVDRRRHV